MYNDIVAIRILPNDKDTFQTEPDFKSYINTTLAKRGGYYYFPSIMMQCDGRTLVLFQYDGMIRAVGVLVDGKREFVTDEQGKEYAGYYRFNMGTVHYLSEPIDIADLQTVHPEFVGFNQSKQRLPLTCKNALIRLLEEKDSYFKILESGEALIKNIEEDFEQMQFHGSTREAMIKIRVNQGVFREKLLMRYHKCCLCGVSDQRMLIASHIKPWSVAEDFEKLDIDNGFLLCPNHDKLFDQGLITFTDDGTICISAELSEIDRVFLNVQKTDTIVVTEQNRGYLKYHREHIFKGKSK